MLITIMVRLVMQVRPHHLSIDVRYQRDIVHMCTTRECIILFTSLPPHIHPGGQLSRLHRDDRPVLARVGVDRQVGWTSYIMQTVHMVNVNCQDRAEQPQQKALSASTSCGLTSNKTWNMATEPITFWQELRQGRHFRQPSELVHLRMFLKWLTSFSG